MLFTNSLALLAKESNFFNISYLKSYPQSTIRGVKAPLQWETANWLLAASLCASGVLIYHYDEEIRDFALENSNQISQSISSATKQLGEGIYVLPALGLTIAGGCLTDSEHLTDTGLLALKSFVLAQCFTQSLKLVSQRSRPSAQNGKDFNFGERIRRKRDSFPSGHTTVVWSIAPILAEQYRDYGWVAPVTYTMASLTSLSRIHDNRHWGSDVFAGAVIGYMAAQLCLKSTPRLQLWPTTQGIAFSMPF